MGHTLLIPHTKRMQCLILPNLLQVATITDPIFHSSTSPARTCAGTWCERPAWCCMSACSADGRLQSGTILASQSRGPEWSRVSARTLGIDTGGRGSPQSAFQGWDVPLSFTPLPCNVPGTFRGIPGYRRSSHTHLPAHVGKSYRLHHIQVGADRHTGYKFFQPLSIV